MALPTGGQLINPNPVVYEVSESVHRDRDNFDDAERDEIDALEIFGTSLLILPCFQ